VATVEHGLLTAPLAPYDEQVWSTTQVLPGTPPPTQWEPELQPQLMLAPVQEFFNVTQVLAGQAVVLTQQAPTSPAPAVCALPVPPPTEHTRGLAQPQVRPVVSPGYRQKVLLLVVLHWAPVPPSAP
jgi:hypothetical protein